MTLFVKHLHWEVTFIFKASDGNVNENPENGFDIVDDIVRFSRVLYQGHRCVLPGPLENHERGYVA